MNAILKSGLGPPPRILRRPAGRARTGLAHRTIDLCIALGERAVGWIEVEVDAGLRPLIEAIWLVRQLVNGSGISRGDEPGELAVEVTSEPGEPVGLMAEDGGTVEAITATGSEGHEPE